MNPQKKYLCLPLILGLLSVTGLVLLMSVSSSQMSVAQAKIITTRYVAPGGSCGGASPCYPSVQAAVDASGPGDEIRVAAGTYTGVEGRPRRDTAVTGVVTQVVYLSQTLTIQGGYTTTNWTTPNPAQNLTTLDAQQKGRVFYITGYINPTIKGLTITRGSAYHQNGYTDPGYDVGAGIYIISATATLMDNQINNNGFIPLSPWSGGGVCLMHSPSTFTGNIISANRGGHGAGLASYNSAAIITNNIFIDNAASGGYGGGMMISYVANSITGNLILHNTALVGGGVSLLLDHSTLNGNLIISNTATSKGGGIDIESSSPKLMNDVIIDNHTNVRASGVFVFSGKPSFYQVTLARNSGGDGSGLYLDNQYNTHSTIVMTNTILVDQSLGITVSLGTTATLNGVLWYNNGNNYSGLGSVTVNSPTAGNPAFTPDGYHLTAGSAAINAGVPSGVATDIDGEPRSGLPDLGADEYNPRIYLPVVIRIP